MSTTKNKIKTLLKDRYEDLLSETENLEKNKFYKVWDVGQEVYILKGL